jgi:cytochrome d ubiquinol oxidase subunit II
VSLVDLTAGVALLALVVYALTGGADFGGGVWDLLARGPRAEQRRALIERAIGPIWEANHVWLILVVVLLFTCFPRAFAAISTALHVPLTLVLLGVVARGTAFVFRHYGPTDEAARWGRLFAISSTLTPFFLGLTFASLTSGIRLDGTVPLDGFLRPWLAPFPLVAGLQVVAVFAWLAATYLVHEADDEGLKADCRRAGLGAGAVALALAGLAFLLAPDRFRDGLLAAWPLLLATGAAGAGGLATLWTGRDGWARALAAAHVVGLVVGWGVGQRPLIVAPDLTLAGAAAPEVTLRFTLAILAVGAALVLPSLYLLLRVFKGPTLTR